MKIYVGNNFCIHKAILFQQLITLFPQELLAFFSFSTACTLALLKTACCEENKIIYAALTLFSRFSLNK